MQTLRLNEDEKKFADFLQRGEPHLPYEKQLVKRHKERIIAILRGEDLPPFELEIQPASGCDARCDHCFGKSYRRCEEKLYEKKNMDRVISQVLNFETNGFKVEIVKFCGSTGEPLVNPLTIHAIEEVYGKRFLRLFTNGIRIAKNKDNDDYLKTLSKINRLDISLDAGTTQTLNRIKPGSVGIRLEEILEGVCRITELSKNGSNIEFGYVITNHNYHEIVEATRKIKDIIGRGLIRFRIDLTDRSVSENHGDEINSLLKEAKDYENEDRSFKIVPVHSQEQIREKDKACFSSKECGFNCFVSRLWTCIGSDANVYPCGHVARRDAENYGSVLEKDLSDIWQSEYRKKVIDKLPSRKCDVCSPFSLRANEFITFLSGLHLSKVEELVGGYENA